MIFSTKNNTASSILNLSIPDTCCLVSGKRSFHNSHPFPSGLPT